MLHLFHISDTIAQNDTTRKRLEVQYKQITEELGIKKHKVHYIASEYGNSEQTGSQVERLITQIEQRDNPQEKYIIMANNANRARHKNSGNAKGSQCLWATIKSPKDIEVVGVDDHVFGVLKEKIKELSVVHDITLNNTTKRDISQGSQFRSLEYFPLVQCILHTEQNEKTYLRTEKKDLNSLAGNKDKEKNKEKNKNERRESERTKAKDKLTRTGNEKNLIKQKDIKKLTNEHQNREDDIRQIQCIGQAQKRRQDRNIKKKTQRQGSSTKKSEKSSAKTSGNQKLIEKYQKIRATLKENELIILDRDHFGNTKCISKHDDGIHGITKHLSIDLGEKIQIQIEENKQKLFSDNCFIVSSISEKTGEKCMRNGSSRGPNGEVFIELNRSIGLDYKNREEIQSIKLGTRITCLPPNKS